MNAEPADPTELAGVAEMGTESVEAWSLDAADEDYPLTGSWEDPERRWTPRRVTVLAVVASVIAIGAVGGLAAWKLRDQDRSSAPDKLMVVVATATTVVVEPVKPPPTLPVRAPASAKPVDPLATYDQRFINQLISEGIVVYNRTETLGTAHYVCSQLELGTPLGTIQQQIMDKQGVSLTEVVLFTSRARRIYPNCP
ncbi:putative Gp32 [uncultured Mycobacterium sp.]|uniref:Putative Gp32 n=1 Tax=uncultured Mycobacterium sp. TaxID=171292 RepID=A0A1Y5PKL0_9MYCO|nr:putative Gp32 [uncultured Mycobacterium sp.]